MNGSNYLVAILFIFLFTSCLGDNTTTQIGPRGVLEGNTFTDDLYGLKLSIPEVWEIDDTSEYDRNTILRLNRNEHYTFELGTESLLTAQHFEDYFNERYHLIKSRSSLISLFGAKSMSNIGKHIVEINGVPFHLITYQFKKEGVKEKFVRAQFYRQTGRNVLTISTIGKVNSTDELGKAIDEVNFASLPPADDSQVTIDRAYYQESTKTLDSDSNYSLYEYGMEMSIPESYKIKRNLYADGWSTRIEKNDQNHIVVTERVIDEGLSFDEHIEKTIKKMNASFGKEIIKLKSRKVGGKKYYFINVSKAIITGFMMESFKEKFIKEKGKEEYNKEYDKTIKEVEGAGSIVLMRAVSDKAFLNIELTYTSKENQDELMEIIKGISTL